MKHHGWIVFAIVGLVLVTGLALMYSGGDLKTAGEAKKFGQQYGQSAQQLPVPPAPSQSTHGTIYADVIISNQGRFIANNGFVVEDSSGVMMTLYKPSSNDVPVLNMDGKLNVRGITTKSIFDESMANPNIRAAFVCVEQNGMLYASQQPCV